MVSKIIAALKCCLKYPSDAMRLMLKLNPPYDPRAVASIKAHCPGIDAESVGFYAGIFLAVTFLAFCVLAYILSLLYSLGGR